MATFYGYKGYIGCHGFKDGLDLDSLGEGVELTSEHLSEALLNDPLAQGQLGFVLDLEKCHFNQEAIDILKNVAKGNDSIGDIDIFDSADKKVIAWMGAPLAIVNSDSIGSSSYDSSLLDNIIVEDLIIPDSLKEFVDSLSEEA